MSFYIELMLVSSFCLDNNCVFEFSVDLRARPLEQAKHWKNERLASRAQFDTSAASTAAFMLSNVSEDDDGIYRCRVDFRHTPTRHVRYQLNVVRKSQLLTSSSCTYDVDIQ
jgi:hypothetical protein